MFRGSPVVERPGASRASQFHLGQFDNRKSQWCRRPDSNRDGAFAPTDFTTVGPGHIFELIAALSGFPTFASRSAHSSVTFCGELTSGYRPAPNAAAGLGLGQRLTECMPADDNLPRYLAIIDLRMVWILPEFGPSFTRSRRPPPIIVFRRRRASPH